MNLYLVRHGQTIENAQDVVMGHHGGNLSDEGITQAEATATKLKDETFDHAWSSDLKRCMDTARIILKYHPSIDLNATPALREVNYGDFQGRPAAEIREYFDKVGFNASSKVPGGESHKEMGARVLNFVNDLLQDNANKKILLVTHNGPIEAIRAASERTPFTEDSENAGIRIFEVVSPLIEYDA